YVACTSFPVTKMTFVMMAAFACYFATHIHRVLIPKDKRMSLSQWKDEMLAARTNEMKSIPVQSIEQLRSSPDMQRMFSTQVKNKSQIRVVFLLFSLPLMGLGVYTGKKMLELSQHGLRAPGEVVSMESESDKDGTTYYPI